MLSRVVSQQAPLMSRSFFCCLCKKSFFNTIIERRSCRKYKNQPIPKGVLESCLGAALTAPTAKNWQPYKVVVLRDREQLDALATTMIPKNAKVIQQVPAAVVFLSDKDCDKLGDEFTEMSTKMGTSPENAKKMVESTRASLPKTEADFKALTAQCVEKSKTQLSMLPYTAREWAIKNTIFPLQTFLLACQSKGLGTIVFEGYDNLKVQSLIKCPDRYIVTDVVAVGVPEPDKGKPTLRYPADHMIYEGEFGTPMKDVPEYRKL